MKSPATQLRTLLLAALTIGLVAGATVALRNSGGVRVEGRLGPTPGPNSKGHIDAKRAYLERLALLSPERPAAGLVSMAKLVPAARATSFTAGMNVSAVFVAFPQGGPEALPVIRTIEATVGARAKEFAEVIRSEISSLEEQLHDAPPANRAGLQKSLNDRRAALRSVGPACLCVYAVAVERSTLGELERLSKRPEVLLVDVPRPVTDALAGWELTPILPAATT